MTERGRRILDLLWIPLVAIMLLPVLIYSVRDRDPHTVGVAGPLLSGRASLDSLLDASRGRIVIVNFWATWCNPCVAELPVIDEVALHMADSVTAVAVNVGDPEMETVVDFREELTLAMPMVWLSPEESWELKEEWDLPDLLPVTAFFDTGGMMYLSISGSRDGDFFREAVMVGASIEDSTGTEESGYLHINVVGASGDPLTEDLLEYSMELAGPEGVDFYDPGVPGDLQRIRELYLPESGYPYAQPCIGSACGRPASTREELLSSVEMLGP
jgi:thiol-disulfide isomerase/thioredoxin